MQKPSLKADMLRGGKGAKGVEKGVERTGASEAEDPREEAKTHAQKRGPEPTGERKVAGKAVLHKIVSKTNLRRGICRGSWDVLGNIVVDEGRHHQLKGVPRDIRSAGVLGECLDESVDRKGDRAINYARGHTLALAFDRKIDELRLDGVRDRFTLRRQDTVGACFFRHNEEARLVRGLAIDDQATRAPCMIGAGLGDG